MLRRTGPLFAVMLSLALATQLACNDDDDSDDGADDAADDADDDAADDAADDDEGTPADDDGGTVDNVAACEDFITAFECDAYDLSMYLMCDIYSNTTCDVSHYFDCLADEVTCDTTGFSNAANTCASLATCG
jgi:hypothetical protein